MITPQQAQIIQKCQVSCTWFLRNFAKLKHPSAGIIPFHPFNYQKSAIKQFRNNRLNIFRKCRQAGISKISGAFATWFAMFHSHKTILIVSRTNEDAMGFLREHIVFLYEHLPPWMKEVWKPLKQNEHEIIFPNNSRIKSLTSHPDVLRSNASSLNIIDEAAFIQGMDVMWAGGWPTLQHGGNVICISTTNGIGNWYWSTWTDAEAGVNGWNPININWWDMDWVIQYKDPLSKQKKRIAPRDNLKKCDSVEEKEKFGPYWSPWLQEQYNALQEQGSDWKFKQEILADFIGSGNTVLPPSVLNHMSTTVVKPAKVVSGFQTYVHPVTGAVEDLDFSFNEADEGLWIWEEPVRAKPSKIQNGVIVEPGHKSHSYVMGVDFATGKGKDYSTIEVIDIDTMEQVAEFMARCLPREFVKFMDRIGRWYNSALAVIERNNGGDVLIDLFKSDYMYPRIWRKTSINDKPRAPGASSQPRAVQASPYGFATSVASKPTLNKYMLDFIRDKEGDGYAIYSARLHKQFQTYVRKRDRLGRDTNKTEAEEGAGNFDDLVIAFALTLVGAADSSVVDAANLIPFAGGDNFKTLNGPIIMSDSERVAAQGEYIIKGGPGLMMPMSLAPEEMTDVSAQRQIDEFTLQLGGIPMGNNKPTVVSPKFYYDKNKK